MVRAEAGQPIDWDAVIEEAEVTGYNPLTDDDPRETAKVVIEAAIPDAEREDYNRVMRDLFTYPGHVNNLDTQIDTACTYAGVVMPSLWDVYNAMLDNGTIDAEAFWRTFESLVRR